MRFHYRNISLLFIRNATGSLYVVDRDDSIAFGRVISMEREKRKSEVWRAAAPNVYDFWPGLRVALTLSNAGGLERERYFWISMSSAVYNLVEAISRVHSRPDMVEIVSQS